MTLTWLHLSDFHVRADDSVDRDSVLVALVKSVEWYRHERQVSPNLIFVTGDLAFSGKAVEYTVAEKWLDAIIEAAGLSRRELFVIPGNHDVDRSRLGGLERTLGSLHDADEYLTSTSAGLHLREKFENFITWYDGYFRGIRSHSASTCGPAELIEVGGRRVGVVPINSAVFCADDFDQSKLWIGRRSLEAAITAVDALDPDLKIALVHHPLDWLAIHEASGIRRALSDGVEVVLRGHLHEPDAEHVTSYAGANLHLAAGAAYQTRQWPNRALYVTVRGPEVRVSPIHYVDYPDRVWTTDPSLFPRALDHTRVFMLSDVNTERSPPQSARAAGARPVIRVDQTTRLIGRHSDLRWLDGLWAKARDGSRQVLLIRGAKGIGKTRLAADWVSTNAGCRVLYGDAGVTGPYEPFPSAFDEQLLTLPMDALKWLVGADGGQLARILTELPDAVRSPVPPEGERGPGRHRLFEAVRSLLRRLAVACPTMLIVDNAHLLDGDGLALLQSLLTLDDVPLLVLLLTRPYGGTPFERALPQLHRDHLIHERDLDPLTNEEAEAFLRARGTVPERGLIREGAGVPVRLEDLGRHPKARGSGSLEHAMISELPPNQRLLIDLAAVGPDPVGERALAQAAGISPDVAAGLLDSVANLGLLAVEAAFSDEDAGEMSNERFWHFTHAVRQQTVLEALDEEKDRALSRQLAEVVALDPTADPTWLADAFSRGGESSKAAAYYYQAARAAKDSLAYDTAATLFEKTVEHGGANAVEGVRRAELGNSIGYCLWHAGKFRDARAAYASAARIAIEDDDPEELSYAALGRAGRIGFEGPSGGAEVAATCEQALERLQGRRPDLRARVLAAKAHAVKFSSGATVAEAQSLVDEAQTLARSLDDANLLVEVLCTTSWAMWVPENLNARRVLAEEAVSLADKLPDEVLRLESRLFRMTCALERGDIRAARVDADAISDLASTEKSPYYLALAAMGRAMLALLGGSEPSEPMIFEALGIAQREHAPALVRVFSAQTFYLRMLQGRLEELRDAAINLAAYDTSIVAWRSGLALLYAEAGRQSDAQRELDAMTASDFSEVPRDTFWLISMDNYARVAAALRDHIAARSLVKHLEPLEAHFVVAAGAGAVHGPVSLNLGVLQGMLGNYETGIRLLDRAEQAARSATCLPAVAEAVVERACLTVASADRASVSDMIDQLRAAVAEVQVVKSKKLARRVSDSIDLCYSLGAADAETASLTAIEELAHGMAGLAQDEPIPRPRHAFRRALAPATIAGIRVLSNGWTDADIERRLSNPRAQRGMLTGMEHLYRPDIAHPFRGVVVLHLTMSDPDAEPIIWSLEVRPDSLERLAEQPNAPDLLVRMRAADFIGMFTGQINGVQQWFEGGCDIQGDPIVASRLVEMFGGLGPVYALAGAT